MSHTDIRARRPANAAPIRLWSRAARALAAVCAALLGCAAGAGEARAFGPEYFIVSNTKDSGPGSLRQAIIDANNTPGYQAIIFGIPGNGTKTIRPLSPLPAVNSYMDIDGSTQPGYDAAGHPLIELDGSLAGPNASGLRVAGGDVELKGLVINRFDAHGVRVTAPGRIISMSACFIGTDAEGAADRGNGGDGIFLSGELGGDASYSAVGWPGTLFFGQGSASLYNRNRNVISGNGGDGIRVTGGHRVQITASFIGTDAAGTLALGNSHNGVYFVGGEGSVGRGHDSYVSEDGTHIGRNVISGNGRHGVLITGTGNEVRVEGSYIGTNAAGDAALGNAMNGIHVPAGPSVAIAQGFEPGDACRNVISGNGENGVEINGSGVRVGFNHIGTNAAGNAAVGNAGHGVLISRPYRSRTAAGNTIGIDGHNVISGNGGDGVHVAATSPGNIIHGSNIGVSADGTARLGNKKNGITIHSSENTIGVLSVSHHNIIGGNGGHGVLLSGAGATGNVFYDNYIGTTHANPDLNLGNAGDGLRIADGAANNRIEHPKTTIAFNGGDGVKITSSLFGAASLRNTVRGVAFYRNGGLGIDLGVSGPTPNDDGDADGGSNELQNYPVVNVSGGQVTGSLRSKPNRTYAVDVYRAQCGPFGHDVEAGERLFNTSVTTDAGGNAGFAFSLPPNFSGAVTAAATDPDGNTSELYPPCAVEPGAISLSAASYSVNEGAGYATITVQYTGTKLTSVNYSATAGTAAPADYVATSGTLYFGAGFQTLTFNVPVVNDPLDEEDETVTLTLSNVTNGSTLAGPASAVLTIGDDDGPPSVWVGNVALTEGNGGTKTFTFDVGLNAPSGKPVTVEYATADGAATAGEDYDAASGHLTFQPGQTARTVGVTVKGDVLNEASEHFFVNLSGLVNVTPGDTQGLGTIINDDKPARLFFGSAAYSVGEGAGVATVQVIRADQTAGPLSVKLISSDGSAAAPADFGAVSATLDFADGETAKTFDVQIVDDPAHEADESAALLLTDPTGGAVLGNPGAAVLTILDDDEAGAPTLSVDDVAAVEGNDGTVKAVFTVALSAASGQEVTVSYATSDGAATADVDYVASSGTLAIPAGSTTGQIVVELKGDTEIEPDETFHVNLVGAVGAGLNDPQGEGTITNDDAELVAFTSARDGNPEIYVMRTDGGQQTRLTVDAGSDRDPAWSPDRRRVAFSGTRNGHADIFVMNADGTEQLALTVDAEVDTQPAWSPDGTRIAFARSVSPGNSEIFIMDADGGMPTQLTFTPTPDAHPAWSPDGAKIAFTCGDTTNQDVCVLDVGGGAVSKLTIDPAADTQPAWSPDGTRIAFVSSRDGDSNIYVMNAGGGDVVRLTYKAGVNRDPAWSADGSGLVFASDRGGAANLEIYKMSADGGGLVKLTSHPAADIEPAWK